MKISGVIIPSGGSPTVLSEQTLNFAEWSLQGDYYQYNFSNVLIRESSVVTFVPNNSSILDASTSLLLPLITSNFGSCVIYSQFLPLNNITGTIIIQ